MAEQALGPLCKDYARVTGWRRRKAKPISARPPVSIIHSDASGTAEIDAMLA